MPARFTICLMVCGLFQAQPALSGGLSDALTFDGQLFAGSTNRVPGANAFLAGDLSARLSFGRFSTNLGMFGRADANGTPHETYGSISYHFDQGGSLNVGVPRPAYDLHSPSAMEDSFPALAVDQTQRTRSAATYGAMFANWLPIGATFDTTVGSYRYSVSLHRENTLGATLLGFGLSTRFDAWAISAAVETDGTSTRAKANLSRDFGLFSAGIGLFFPNAPGNPTFVEGNAAISATDRVKLTSVVQLPTNGGAATAGIVARYSLTNTTGLSIGALSDAGAPARYSTFLDVKF